MAIILKLVTQRASGGAIERVRRIDGDTLLIGRGADCDLHLQDLAVGLEHARLTRMSQGRVRVEGLAGQRFQANGRFVGDATLKVSERPTLGFGGYTLALDSGETDADIEVHVSRDDESGASSKVEDELRQLAPEAVGVNKRVLAWMLVCTIFAMCLAIPVGAFFLHQNDTIHADQQWSAGQLSKSHAFLDKDCQSCHAQAFVAVRDEACLTCHKADTPLARKLETAVRLRSLGADAAKPLKSIRDHADHDRLLHSTPLPDSWGGKIKVSVERLFGHEETRCVGCHREHVTAGAKAPLVGDPAKSAPEKPTLVLVQDCAGCHGQLKARLADTTLIDTPDWSHHPDFRPLATINPGTTRPMTRLPAKISWTERSGLIFPHRVHLAPDGAVARNGQVLGAARGYGGALTCASCHRPDKSGGGFQPIRMERDCKSCHALAFGGADGRPQPLEHHHPEKAIATIQAYYGAAQPERMAAEIAKLFSSGGACFDCHVTRKPTGADQTAWTVAPVQLTTRYLPAGSFDHSVPQHRKAVDGHEICSDCHKVGTSDKAEPILLPHIAECRTCHGKTHEQTPAAAATDCAECHSYHAPGQPGRPMDRDKAWPPTGSGKRSGD